MVAFLLTSLFASANTVNSNKEIESKKIVVITTIRVNKTQAEMEDILRYCTTRVNYWYTGQSGVGMDGQTYYVYEVETTTTCYTV